MLTVDHLRGRRGPQPNTAGMGARRSDRPRVHVHHERVPGVPDHQDMEIVTDPPLNWKHSEDAAMSASVPRRAA